MTQYKVNLENLSINSVLDAGCGPGYGLEYLKSLMPNITLFGIEASPYARYVLKNNVGAIIEEVNIFDQQMEVIGKLLPQ
ncbi:class I SAM-dependent methyltransferase [Gammaproteobacteria bacterium]|nr:class I SAM-dependent methyltransferase [Gammaproteobacteria bacterium]